MNHAALRARIEQHIDASSDGQRHDDTRDALLAEVSTLQAQSVDAYRKFVNGEVRRPLGRLPALPTDVFRYARVAAHAPSQDLRVFRTSGTTAQARGSHFFGDLSLYDRAARAAARYALFPDRERMRLLVLAAPEHEARDSSLSYMLARFMSWFGNEHSQYVWRDGALDLAALTAALRAAQAERAPIALLGTSFAFVHAHDALGHSFQLPQGSRIMQTGGFKGKSRSVEPEQMLELLHARYGVPDSCIVQEYGMSELSSQLYETTLRDELLGLPPAPRALWVPGWVRAQPINPQTLEPVAEGNVGLLRIDDLANLHSVCAIQTSDLAIATSHGLRVLGRAQGAVPRGCSIAADEWLAS